MNKIDSERLTTAAAFKLVEKVSPLFAGHEPELIGSALAMLTATYLASHSADSRGKTQEMREMMLAIHVQAVLALVPIEEERIHGRGQEQAKPH